MRQRAARVLLFIFIALAIVFVVVAVGMQFLPDSPQPASTASAPRITPAPDELDGTKGNQSAPVPILFIAFIAFCLSFIFGGKKKTNDRRVDRK